MKTNAPEGYFLIDHSASPGITPEFAALTGAIAVGPGEKFEAAAYRCNHCQNTVVKSPTRKRERAFCPKCSLVICDLCEAARVGGGYVCNPVEKQIDDFLDAIAHGG